MWKNYSADYIKNNRASGISIKAAAFIAALFLSFLCCLFYHFWLDSVEGIESEEGGWHGRITGDIDEAELARIHYFANVEKAAVNEELSKEKETVVDVYFYNKRTVYQDMSAILPMLGLTEEAAEYHYQLLSLYFIRIPGDDKPRLLMPAYLGIVGLVCISLILVIHNSFAVSMDSRIHQFGIFSSIGATPRQILVCLVQEALALAAVPILLGILSGIVFSFGTVQVMNAFAADFARGRQVAFRCHPVILLLILFLSVSTVIISAWFPARRLSRITPLEAIRGTEGWQPEKQRFRKQKSGKQKTEISLTKYSCFYQLFGIEGELAASGLRARKKALRTTSLSLTLAFSGFMLMQCFWTLSGISTNHTYFEKYQDVWDVMATVKDTPIENFMLTEEIRELAGADSSMVYQKAEAVCILPREVQSQELLELGGLEAVLGESSSFGDDLLLAKASVIILDDESFKEFCRQAGTVPRLDGTIVLNRLWDSLNSNFRYPKYIPYVKEEMETVVLGNAAAKGGMTSETMAELPVLACTEKYPLLREEYGKSDGALVQFIPVSLWKKIKGQIGGAGQDTYIRVLADNRTEFEVLNMLKEEITQVISQKYHAEIENRIQEKLDNDKMIRGYEWISGAFCALLAVIGIAHVFSHTLGFLRQRKREFARLQSVGLTPEGMRKIFCMEALTVVGCPMLTSLVLTTAAVSLMIKISYLDPIEFFRAAPVAPILLFVLMVFGFVALAYYLGGKKMLNISLADALRGDSLM